MSETLHNWGLVFEPHRHNEYVMYFGSICNRYGIEFREALDYAEAHFSHEYPDTAAVIKSCYKKTERFGSPALFQRGRVVSWANFREVYQAVALDEIPDTAQHGDRQARDNEPHGGKSKF